MKNTLKRTVLCAVLCVGMLLPSAAFAVDRSKDMPILISIESSVSDISTESPFSDVKTTDWYFPYVDILYAKGVVSGVGDGLFNPNSTVTAGEFLAVAARLLCPDRIDMRSASEHWSFPYFDALKSASLFSGDNYCSWIRSPKDRVWNSANNSTKYGMAALVSRTEMAEVLTELTRLKGETLTKIEKIENNLDDSAFCNYEVLKCYSAGLLSGKSDGNFDPFGHMTRAEMCVVLCRLMNFVPRPEIIVQPQKQSDYIITAPIGDKGKIKFEYAREVGLKALSQMYIGEDKKGVYFSVTAPVLPKELQDCEFSYGATPYKANGDYFVENGDFSLRSGESHKVYFVTYQGTPLRPNQIGFMTVDVSLHRPKYGYSTAHIADTSTKEKVLERRSHRQFSDEKEVLAYDVSHIFAGIGK